MVQQAAQHERIVPFKCQFCGSQDGLLKGSTKPKSYRNLIRSACGNCGHIFSDDDIKKATRDFAIKLAKDAFQRAQSLAYSFY
jgi:hypothetical protein